MSRIIFLLNVLFLALITSCSWTLSEREYLTKNDNYEIRGSLLEGTYYNGRSFRIRFDAFEMKEREWVFEDRIVAGDQVLSGVDILSPIRLEVLSVRDEESFQIRRCLFETSIDIYIQGFHEMYHRELNFQFEAEEVFQQGWRVSPQPYRFRRGKTVKNEISLRKEDEKDCQQRFLLQFPIEIYDPYDDTVMYSFEYIYDVVVEKSDVWVDPENVTVTITENWKPE